MRPLRRLIASLVIAAFAATALAACGDDSDAAGFAEGKLAVVATTSVLADFVQVVGGDRVSVYQVLKPNVDAHDFEPTPKDIEALRSATVVVKNGVELETWIDDALKASATKATVVDTSEGVTLREGSHEEEEAHAGDKAKTADKAHAGDKAHADDKAKTAAKADDHEHGEHDPHIWHDPRNAKVMVDNVTKALSAADPAGAATFQANATAYKAKLDTLDKEIEGKVATLSNKKVVTNHDAFGYYLDRYGLTFVGSVIPSFDSATEVSAADVDALVKAVKAEGVKAIFTESTLPSKVAKTVAKEAGVKVVEGESALYGDGLGTKSSKAGTYLDMMRHNTDTLVKNLA